MQIGRFLRIRLRDKKKPSWTEWERQCYASCIEALTALEGSPPDERSDVSSWNQMLESLRNRIVVCIGRRPSDLRVRVERLSADDIVSRIDAALKVLRSEYGDADTGVQELSAVLDEVRRGISCFFSGASFPTITSGRDIGELRASQ
jgi:hypothetical protein